MPENVAVEEVIIDDVFPGPQEEVVEPDTKEPVETLEEEEIEVETLKGGQADLNLQQELLGVSQRLQQLELENAELKGRVSATPPVKAEAGEKDLTDADLMAIIRENKDDESVLLRVFKHVAEKTATKIADDKADTVLKSTAYSQWEGEMKQVNESIAEADPRMRDPKFKSAVDRTVKKFSLEGHPAAESLGIAFVTLGLQYAAAEKEAAAKKGQDVDRKEKAKVDLGTKGSEVPNVPKKGSAKLTSEQLAFCKAQGINPDTYAKFVK